MHSLLFEIAHELKAPKYLFDELCVEVRKKIEKLLTDGNYDADFFIDMWQKAELRKSENDWVDFAYYMVRNDG